MLFMKIICKKRKKGAVYAETSKMQKSLSFPQCFRDVYKRQALGSLPEYMPSPFNIPPYHFCE